MTKDIRLGLVVPNFRWSDVDSRFLWHYLPYNLCLLAAMVKEHYKVKIIDANKYDMTDETFRKALAEFRPDVVGITVLMDLTGPAGHHTAKLVKQVDPNIQVIMGGAYVTVNPDRTIQDNNVDYGVIGEGEYVIKNLVDYITGDGQLPEVGVCYRENGLIINKGRYPLIEDLDSLPLPAYDLIDFEAYSSSITRRGVDSPSEFPFARVFSSRGCPQNCCFCQVHRISGRKFRARSAENVLDEIEWLKSEYGVRSILFDDDNLLCKRKRAVAIFQGLKDRGLCMPWKTVTTAVFHLDKELLELMSDSGCQFINVAIESGVERILKEIIRKPINLKHAKEMIQYAQDLGIYVAANFIVGFPTESWPEIRETIKVAEEINADYTKIFAAMPLQGTRLWELCEKKNAFRKGFDPAKLSWNVGQIETEDFTADDLTVLRAYEWDRINFMSHKKIQKTAKMLQIDENQVMDMRRATLNAALEEIRSEGPNDTY